LPRGGDNSNYGGKTCEKCGGTVVDVLVGGTPCQSFSVAGLRKGLDDPRGNLMLTYLAIADRYRPTWLVWENVPGVLSSNGGNDFASLLRGLGELGYGFAYRILDAQYFGVPQRRRRVFVVGHLGDWRRAAAVLFERHSLSGHPAPSREAGKRVAKTVTASLGTGGADYDTKELIGGIDYENNGHGPTGPTGPLLKGSPTGGGRPLPAIVQAHRQVAFGEYVNDDTASTMKMRDYKDATDLVTHSLRGEGFDASEDGTGHGTPLVPVAIRGTLCGRSADKGGPGGTGATDDGSMWTLSASETHAVAYSMITANTGANGLGVAAEVAPTLDRAQPCAVAFAHQAGGTQTTLGYDQERGTAPTLSKCQTPAVATYSTPAIGDIRADAVASCISKNTGAGGETQNPAFVQQSMQVRRLTPRECERLQGFPDDYTQVPYRNKPAADGPRYKALGNSMAVPVMAWIGKRIQQVEDISA